MQEKISSGQAENYDAAEQKIRLEAHVKELQGFGLPGLEGRVQRGLDPAGMLAVGEIRKIVEEISKKAEIDTQELEELTKALHTGAIWEKADDLAKAEKPEVKAWMLLADECHEVNDKDLSAKEYLQDVDRIKKDLEIDEKYPEAALDKAVEKIVAAAKGKFVKKEGVPFSEEDAFLYMAIAGEKYGVCKAGDLYFAGANQLDYSALEKEGLIPVEREDRGRMAIFFQREGKDIVKKLYPGLAIVFGDEELALKLAKSAERFIEKDTKETQETRYRVALEKEYLDEISISEKIWKERGGLELKAEDVEAGLNMFFEEVEGGGPHSDEMRERLKANKDNVVKIMEYLAKSAKSRRLRGVGRFPGLDYENWKSMAQKVGYTKENGYTSPPENFTDLVISFDRAIERMAGNEYWEEIGKGIGY